VKERFADAMSIDKAIRKIEEIRHGKGSSAGKKAREKAMEERIERIDLVDEEQWRPW